MRKKLITVVLGLAILLTTPLSVIAQQNSFAYLEANFPKLTGLYRNELSKCNAHYIFAIDVSKTMTVHKDVVCQNLVSLFQALPDGDKVDVIPFGTEVASNSSNFSGVIDANSRTSLSNNIPRIYDYSNYGADFGDYTDIYKAVDAITGAVDKKYQINVIVLISDFRHEAKGDKERKFTDDELEKMGRKLRASTDGAYNRYAALELPVDRNMPGYCLDQLVEGVFTNGSRPFDKVFSNNSSSQIAGWFEKMKNEIMRDKLRAVVEAGNIKSKSHLEVKMNIDGKVTAEFHWVPSKLYPTIKLDSVYVKQSGFTLKMNDDAKFCTTDSVIGLDPELLLGEVVHDSYFFHQFNDSIYLSLSLPTDGYDVELQKLDINKPIPSSSIAQDRAVFTFFLPFWLTVTLAVLILLYIIGVINAMKRNRKCCFKGNFTFYDDRGNQLDDIVRLGKQSPSAIIKVGAGGSPRLSVDGAEWSFTIQKVNGNPFLVFAKPYFKWSKKTGYVGTGKAQSGRLSHYGSKNLRVQCGRSKAEQTHSVKVQLLSNQ